LELGGEDASSPVSITLFPQQEAQKSTWFPSIAMMLSTLRASLLLLLSQQLLGSGIASAAAAAEQHVLKPPPQRHQHAVDPAILRALEAHADPVDALLSLRPSLAAEMAEPRLLHVSGDAAPRWMTEGDKLRLRRQRRNFADVTDHEDVYHTMRAEGGTGALADKARMSILIPT